MSVGGSEVWVACGAEVAGNVAVTKLGVFVAGGANSTEPQLTHNKVIKAINLFLCTDTIVSKNQLLKMRQMG